MRILPKMFSLTPEERYAREYRDLIHEEAKIGGAIFGPLPAGHRREFFCIDPTTWVWHEEWLDEQGERHIMTTRYDVRPTQVLKTQDGNRYQPLTRNEAIHLYRAAELYQKRVDRFYAQQLQTA